MLVVPVLLGVMLLVTAAHGVQITWLASSTDPVLDSAGAPLLGASAFGTPDLSNGSLVQLWQAVGEIDDPAPLMQRCGTPCVDPNWSIDDVLLDQSHVGYGTFISDGGTWSAKADYALGIGAIAYVRAYNMSLPEIEGLGGACPVGLEIGIRDSTGGIPSLVIEGVAGQPIPPHKLYADGLRTEPCVPEPAALLFLAPGLAIWALRRKK